MNSTSTYTVQGMTCGSCATKVSQAVEQVSGVTGTEVDVTSGRLTVAGPDVDENAVRSAIAGAGYQLG